MTDKEWKKLCNWVKKLNCARIESKCEVDVEALEDGAIYIKSLADNYCLGYKVGLRIEQDGMIYSRGEVCIAENRTSQQIKAIIRNLVEEANND